MDGKLLTNEFAIEDVAAKAAAFRETGAVAVDMESLGVARIAAAHSLPFIAVRVIVDTAGDMLPDAISAATRSGVGAATSTDFGDRRIAAGSRATAAVGRTLSNGDADSGRGGAHRRTGAAVRGSAVRSNRMRALVTGASGFVGAAIARALVNAGWEVRVLVRAASDRSNLQSLPLEIAVGDLTVASSLRGALAGCEALFHAAADYRLGAPDPSQLYRTNVEGTRSLLIAAGEAGGREDRVHEQRRHQWAYRLTARRGDERTPVTLAAMIGHYKRSKYLAEQVVLEAASAGTPAVIVNPSTPVGAGDVKPTPTGQLVLDAAAGRMPAYVDTGLNIVHVDDVAAGHLLAFHHGRIGERYILGGDDMTLQQILIYIAQLVGRKPPRIRLPYAAILPMAYVAEALAKVRGRSGRLTLEGVRMSKKHMFFSSAKAARELGYRWRPPARAFDDAVHWFRERGLLN